MVNGPAVGAESGTIPRRSILASASTATGVAGCLDDSGPTEATPASATTGPAATPAAPRDPQPSGRVGATVYYDPERPGPYENGADALSDVPDGGTFWIAPGVYDVSEEGGTLALDRPITIRGSGAGWGRIVTRSENDRNLNLVGTVIRNRSIDEPTIAFRGNAPEKTIQGATIRGLTVDHRGDEDAPPGVLMRDSINTLIADCRIQVPGGPPTGLKYEGRGFFARVVRTAVGGFSDIGIHVAGGGYSHEFYSVWSSSGRDGVTTLQTEVSRSIIVGGEFAATGAEGTAIRFWAPDGDSHPPSGGVVIEPGIEHSATSIDVDGERPFENVQIYGSLLPLGPSGNVDIPAVRFGNARNCKLLYPVLPTTHGRGELAHWSAESENCGIVTEARSIAGHSYTAEDGALNPYVSLVGATDDRILSTIPTGVPTTVEFNQDANGAVYHDGSNWRQYRSDSYSVDR
jgi:hypothetical protein